MSIASLGPTIRAARREAGMTLKELALASRLSISYLSQIERDLLVPSVDALRRIASTVELPAGALEFAAGTARGKRALEIVRCDARKRFTFGESDIVYELLTPDAQGRVSVLALTVPPGAESGEAFSHPGEDIVIVGNGVLDIEVGGFWHRIEAGDSIRFTSEIPHRWRNSGDAELTATWISTPPWL
jgi:transcriptional regulator with XRE-family HTH domain